MTFLGDKHDKWKVRIPIIWIWFKLFIIIITIWCALSWYAIYYRWRLSHFSQPMKLSKGWSLLDKATLSKRQGSSCQKSHDVKFHANFETCNLARNFELNLSKCIGHTCVCLSKPHYKAFNARAPHHLCFYSTSHKPNLGASTSSTNAQLFDQVECSNQCPGRFLDIIGRDPSVSKSNRLRVDIPQVFQINLGCFLYIPQKQPVISLKSWTSTRYLSNSTDSSLTSSWFLLFISSNSLAK